MKLKSLLLGLAVIGLSGCSTLGEIPERKLALFRATVLIEHDKGHLTGFLVDKDRVLTVSNDVPDDGLEISFFHGEEDQGEVIWRDEGHDLALVKITVPDRYKVPRLRCYSPTPKLYYETIGHPISARWVLTGGYFHDLEPVGDRYRVLSYPLALGMAGAPMYDMWGNMMGIVHAILASRREGADAQNGEFKDYGYGLMRPASGFCDDLKRALADNA
ncbi:MAG: serine protease [Pseudomonadota bacterium]